MMITNKKILVTGAGGFVGSHLALKLFEQKNFVRAADVKWDGYLPQAYSSEQMTLDLREKDSCRRATAGIDYVFNLAANMGGIGFITDIGADIMYDNLLINTHIARFHNIYGPEGTYDGGREKSPAALCRKVALATTHESIEIWGDGNQTRSYCYMDDCIEGILRLMESGYDKPLNIGSDAW